MRPPICIICDKALEDLEKGGLISFQKTESDVKWDQEMAVKEMVGHPPYVEWFCKKHYTQTG